MRVLHYIVPSTLHFTSDLHVITLTRMSNTSSSPAGLYRDKTWRTRDWLHSLKSFSLHKKEKEKQRERTSSQQPNIWDWDNFTKSNWIFFKVRLQMLVRTWPAVTWHNRMSHELIMAPATVLMYGIIIITSYTVIRDVRSAHY